MSKKIVLIGGGGHCKSVLDTLLRNKEYDEIIITDYDITAGTKICGCEVIGNDDLLPKLLENGFLDAFITVGSIKSTALRRRLFNLACQIGFNIVNIIDRSAVISEYSKFGKGVFVGKYSVINADAQIGNCAIINTGAIVEHECSIGDFAHVSVGSKLCGNVTIENDSFIGAGSTVIQGITVGKDSIIGAGSIVIKNVEEGSVRYGVVK